MDIPKDLLEQIRYIEELFTVDATKLKAISDHFVSELAKGTIIHSLYAPGEGFLTNRVDLQVSPSRAVAL